jgi:phage gpG-like protein
MAARVTVTGIPTLAAQFDVARRLFGSPEPLLKALGVTVLGWVGQTFRAGGRPPWAALKPSTIAGRRQGKGRGSAQPLQNTGALRRGFELTTTNRTATVFNTSPIARYQQEGTRGPYEIRAKNGKALALPFVPGRDGGGGSAGSGRAGSFSLAGLGRSTRTASGGFQTPKGKRAPVTNASFYAKVIHPGLPARPMLPTPAQIQPVLQQAGQAFLARALGNRGGGGGAPLPRG